MVSTLEVKKENEIIMRKTENYIRKTSQHIFEYTINGVVKGYKRVILLEKEFLVVDISVDKSSYSVTTYNNEEWFETRSIHSGRYIKNQELKHTIFMKCCDLKYKAIRDKEIYNMKIIHS